MNAITLISDKAILTARIAHEERVVVYAMTPWSGPCRMATVSIAQLANEYSKRLTFYQVDLEATPSIAGLFTITTVPTLLLFEAGQLKRTVVGLWPKETIAEKLEVLL